MNDTLKEKAKGSPTQRELLETTVVALAVLTLHDHELVEIADDQRDIILSYIKKVWESDTVDKLIQRR